MCNIGYYILPKLGFSTPGGPEDFVGGVQNDCRQKRVSHRHEHTLSGQSLSIDEVPARVAVLWCSLSPRLSTCPSLCKSDEASAYWLVPQQLYLATN